MKTSIRNLMVAGVAGVALVSAAVAMGGGASGGGFGPSHAGYGPAAMGHDHGPWAGGHGHGMRGHGPMGVESQEAANTRLDVLKRSLAITAQQEPAWNAFAEVAGAQAKRMGEFRDEMRETARTLPERIDQASKHARERDQAFAEVGVVAKKLYEVLTPEQRAKVDRRGPWMF